MRICFEQYLNSSHSWGECGLQTALALQSLGHEIHLKSTNGWHFVPESLKPCIREKLDSDYDMQFSYTAMLNFPHYLSHGNKNRFGMWCYEFPIIPRDFPRYHQFCDKLLAPSNFAREIFIQNKVPAEKVVRVPHGFHLSSTEEKYPLKTKKTHKILMVIGQPHLRKNIKGALEAYCKAFTKEDDVCLVAKIAKVSKIQQAFEIDPLTVLNQVKKQYPSHAEIELITDFIPDMTTLYNACDIVYTLSYAEGFYLPGIQGLAKRMVCIAPRYGGQLDFMNDNNSLLIEGKIAKALAAMQYWNSSPYNGIFESEIDDAANKLKKAVFEFDSLKDKFLPGMKDVISEYTWENASKKLVELCQ